MHRCGGGVTAMSVEIAELLKGKVTRVHIGGGIRFVEHLGGNDGRFGQGPPQDQRRGHPPDPAEPRTGAVTNGVGDSAAFRARGFGGPRIPCEEGRVGMPPQDLTQSPLVPQCPREFARLGQVGPRHVGVVGRDTAARSQGPCDQSRVTDFARELQRPFGLVPPIGCDAPCVQ